MKLPKDTVQFYRWGTTDRGFSGVRGPNFTKLGEDIGRSWLGYTRNLSQSSDILLHCAAQS